MNDMTIIPAGAGSGKTFRIKTDLTAWVKAKKVRPERIMAVTFTEAAAGELRDRIQASLLQAGMVDEAMAVERAYISTIHALGLRLMTEHAFAAGASPSPRQLSDAERELLLRIELARSEVLEVIKADLPRYGYAGAYGGKTIEDDFRGIILKAVDVLQGLGEGATNPALVDAVVAELRENYGPVVADGAPLAAAVREAASALLRAYRDGGKPFANSDAARKDFEAQHRALREAVRPGELERNWKLWTILSKLRVSGKKLELPEDFVALSNIVRTAAERIAEHPGPLADACTNLRAVVLGAQEVMQRYSDAKRKAGVIDFADMITSAERLLRTRPDVLDALLAEVDCVIIDEFQDTNPVQFALLWRIAQRAPRTLLVGDTKQSIMGFQGADPRLTAELERQFTDNVDPLKNNRRSDPRIMAFVNEVSARMFGERYIALTPTREPTGETALELIAVTEGRKSRKAKPELHIAARIKRLLDGGDTLVIDRYSGEKRPVRPGDIALLCRTHAQGARYADKLRELSVPVRINQNGWLDSPVVQAARAALAYVADPDDHYSALLYLTLGPPALDLQTAMLALADGKLAALHGLEGLTALSARAAVMPLASLLGEIMKVAGIFEWGLGLSDPRQMRANLLRLEAEVANFEAAHRDMKAAAGFYGETAPVFLGWLEAQRKDRDFDRQPDPESSGATGVEIVTWHSSKGREWNIVVVVGLDTKVEEKAGNVWAEFSSFDNLGEVLNSAQLKFTPRLPVPEKQKLFTAACQASVNEDARRLLYVALTRARDRMLLEWPLFQLTKRKPESEDEDGVSYATLLADEADVSMTDRGVSVGAQAFDARLTHCGSAVPPEFETAANSARTTGQVFGTECAIATVPLTPWVRNPSQAIASEQPGGMSINVVDLGVSVDGSIDPNTTYAERGTAWHLAYRVALSAPHRYQAVAAATGLDTHVLESIARQAEALKAWLTANGYTDIYTELPVQLFEADGSSASGVVDCVAIGPAGGLVIDHKSGAAPDLQAGVERYAAQIEGYKDILAKLFADRAQWKCAINFVAIGKLALSK